MVTAGLASVLNLSENSIPSLYTVGESDVKCTITRNIGCQTDPPRKKSVGTQIKNTYFRSEATQTSLCSESVGVGPPVDWRKSPSLLISTYPESFQPSKKCRLTLDDDDDECDGDSIEVTLSKWRSQQIQKAVPSGDALNSTNDPESSADATAEIIDFSDESDSSDEGSSEVDEEEYSSHENLCKLCSECGTFFYSQAHTCGYKKPYSCIVCGKRYNCEVQLKVHSKIHQDGYKHACKYCCATFRTRSDKLVHDQSHLPAEKPYQCPDCPEVFAKMRERNVHLVTHRGPKRYICLICNMEFSKNHILERHVVVHTKVKQFVCEVCQRSFTQSSHLKSHMRVHTGEKPYQCHHCDKSFNHNVSLKSHIQRYHGQVPEPGMKVQMEKTSRSESEAEKDETNEMESSAVDAEEDEKSKDTLCNTENGAEEDKSTKVQKEDRCTNKYPRPGIGRPRGRPKKNVGVTLVDANQLKRRFCNGDENEDGQGNSDLADVEQEHDSDSDFDPAGQRSKEKQHGAKSRKDRGRRIGKQK